MRDLAQFLAYMNDVDFPYVVLRNFENLPYSAGTDGHNDIDLLVYDFAHWREIFPQAVPVYPYPRAIFKMTIGGENVYIDVRHIGDGYYPKHFQESILNTREWNTKGFFTPEPNHFRIALAYHAVHHKGVNSYQKHIGPATIPELLESLKKSPVGYTIPTDPSVGAYNQYFKGATGIVSRENGVVVKTQTGWKDYSLIDNEDRILNLLNSRHFPKCEKNCDGTISIEDCGDRLTVDNAPANWKAQLIEIIEELHNAGILHRDIKPDNLMVRDGVVKLIDFGWAKHKDDFQDNPPSCLGYPYKPSWGFDDKFSMKKVIRELEYQFDERKVLV